MKLCTSEPKCRNSTSSRTASVEFLILISKNLQNSIIEQNINDLVKELRKNGISFSYSISYKDDITQNLIISVIKSGRENKIYFIDNKNIQKTDYNYGNNQGFIEVLTEREKNEILSVMKSQLKEN